MIEHVNNYNVNTISHEKWLKCLSVSICKYITVLPNVNNHTLL